MSDKLECPKCKHEHVPTGDHEIDTCLWECDECGFEFVKCEVDDTDRQSFEGKVLSPCRYCGTWYEVNVEA